MGAFDATLPLLGLPDTVATRLAGDAGLRTVIEAFADRTYTADGGLVPRGNDGAILHDPDLVADRMLELVTTGTVEGTTVTIEVHYDGPDLDRVAELIGLDAAQVVAAHTERLWRVAFGGFAPGFAYLDGGDERLAVPRLETPRTEVPAGSVGLADGYSGIYPRSSPGGWQLIGRTAAVLWDADREPPALLRPGWWVQFVAVDR